MNKNKISIRFFDDREVRAVWDEENSKWWFSVLDKIAILARLERNGIERKVDLVIRTPKHTHNRIYKEVMTKGISLC